MKRKFVSFICLLAAAVMLIGCGGQGAALSTASYNAQKDMITVKDCAGREVSIPKEVKRIACLFAVSGDAVVLLGKGDDIVSVVEGLKRDLVLKDICPAIDKAAAPRGNGAINMEELVKSDPDVAFVDMQTASDKAQTDQFDKFKIPYVVIDFGNMEEQRYAMEVVAKVVGDTGRIKKYEEFYDRSISIVSERVKDIPQDKRVKIYHSVNEATRTDTVDSLSADIIQLAGGIDVSVDQDLNIIEDKYYASLEQILLWNPDVIMVNEQGVDQYIIKNEQWKNIKAVKDNKVIKMPNGVSRWGHPNSMETPLAILWIAKTLYPDKFQDVDINAETKKFYSEFFNFNLSDDLVNKILAGNGMRLEKK